MPSLDSVPFIISLMCYVPPSTDGSVPPPSPPSEIPPELLSLQISLPVHVSLPPPLSSSLSVCSFAVLLLGAPVVTRRPPVWLTGGRCHVVSESRCLMASLPNLCGWWYLARVWVEGRRRRHPPAMVLSSSTRRQASPGVWFFFGLRTRKACLNEAVWDITDLML